MRQPRVTIVTGSGVVWGAEMSLLAIAEEINLPVRLMTSNTSLASQWARRVGEDVVHVRARAGRITRTWGFLLPLLRELSRTDVVVLFDFYLVPLLFLLRPLAKMRGVKIVVDVHDVADRNPKRRPYFALFRFTDLAIAISNYVAGQLPRRTKFSVIYRPVSDPFNSPRNERSSANDVTYGVVGQVSPDKAVLETLIALRDARIAGTVVVRGSASPDHADYAEQVQKFGRTHFGTRFRYEGRVARDRAVSDIDVLVVGNAGEPFGRTAAEAQLAGVLVVGPSEGGIGEIIDDGVTGFAFQPGNSLSMTSAIVRASDEARVPSGISNAAAARARERFDPIRQAHEYGKALTRIAS